MLKIVKKLKFINCKKNLINLNDRHSAIELSAASKAQYAYWKWEKNSIIILGRKRWASWSFEQTDGWLETVEIKRRWFGY